MYSDFKSLNIERYGTFTVNSDISLEVGVIAGVGHKGMSVINQVQFWTPTFATVASLKIGRVSLNASYTPSASFKYENYTVRVVDFAFYSVSLDLHTF